MSRDPVIGIFLQTVFPVPGWYLRDMGLAGWKSHLDWAKSLGFNACMFSSHVQLRLDQPECSLHEARRLYHGLLAPRPAFGPGEVYYEKDPELSTPEVRRIVDTRIDAMRYASSIGFHTVVGMKLNVGAPTFARDNPHLQAVTPDDFCNEGLPLCPSQPKAIEHLLDLWGTVVDTYPEVDGFSMWGRDSGGCACEACRSKENPFLDTIQLFYDMIRKRRPDAKVYVMSWGFDPHEIPPMARALPKDVISLEPPGMHYPGHRSAKEHSDRIEAWLNSGIEAQGWAEIQENPTFLLPACYPQRIETVLQHEREAGVSGMWSSATINAFVFPLNHYVFARLARNPGMTAREATEEYLSEALGEEAVPDGMAWVDAMEDVWTRLYSSIQRKSFGLPLHTVFAASLFPVPLMNEPPPPGLVDDIDATVQSAERAVEAIESATEKGGWRYHSLDSNILVVSTKLVCLRARFRQAKLAVLEAIRAGDVEGAAAAFEPVAALAQEMVDMASCAPNTQILNTHWTKLALLPDRLAALRDHLPSLVHMKRIRGLFDDDPLGHYVPKKG